MLCRLREAWGAGRPGHRTREAFHDALNSLVRRREVNRVDGSFTFLGADQLAVVRVPSVDDRGLRTIAQVYRAEQLSAVQHLVNDALRVSRDELTLEVCHLFGWNRRGPDIAAALEDAIDVLVQAGGIVDDGDFLTTP